MRNPVIRVLAFSLLLAPAAHAADLPGRGGALSPAPVFSQAAPYSWNGFYAGLNAGYGWGSFNRGASTVIGNSSGGLLGGQVGYNAQFGSLVAGVEADADISWISGSKAVAPGVASKGKLEWFGTLRGRLGFAADRALIYATGGYAGGSVKATIVDTVIPATFTTSGWRNGYALGAGIEYAFTNNISAKAEYLYMNLGSRTLFAAPWVTSSTYSVSTIRAGVNYHF